MLRACSEWRSCFLGVVIVREQQVGEVARWTGQGHGPCESQP